MCFQLQYIAFDLFSDIALRNVKIYYCHPNQELICVRVSELLPPLPPSPPPHPTVEITPGYSTLNYENYLDLTIKLLNLIRLKPELLIPRLLQSPFDILSLQWLYYE